MVGNKWYQTTMDIRKTKSKRILSNTTMNWTNGLRYQYYTCPILQLFWGLHTRLVEENFKIHITYRYQCGIKIAAHGQKRPSTPVQLSNGIPRIGGETWRRWWSSIETYQAVVNPNPNPCRSGICIFNIVFHIFLFIYAIFKPISCCIPCLQSPLSSETKASARDYIKGRRTSRNLPNLTRAIWIQ